jgi:Na+-translocating ferredoxin:NAD+ oxidoreductase subunit C
MAATMNGHVTTACDFDGGLVLEQARRSRGTELASAPLPPLLRLPLCHGPSPLRTIVGTGERVQKGQLIACGTVDLHAPTSGEITGIALQPATHPAAPAVPALLLAADGLDVWHPHVVPVGGMPQNLEDLARRIHHAGIAGLGGAGYPLLAKLERACEAAQRPLLIVNAVESEPGMTSDEALLHAHAGEVVTGIETLCGAAGIRRCLIALDPDNVPARSALEAALGARAASSPDIAIVLAPPRFPAGSERQLIQALTGTRLAPGQRPTAAGYLVLNPATVHGLHRAVSLGQPLIERIVTITGPAIPNPVHRWVRIGHPITDLLDAHLPQVAAQLAGGELEVLHGGPVTGWPLAAAAVVGKQTYGLYARRPRWTVPRPCINCSRCVDVCPERLLPQVLLRLADSGQWPAAQRHGIEHCIECGACDLVCPSELPLLRHFRHSKSVLARRREADARAQAAKQRFEQHQQRASAQQKLDRERRDARLHRLKGAPTRWLPP